MINCIIWDKAHQFSGNLAKNHNAGSVLKSGSGSRRLRSECEVHEIHQILMNDELRVNGFRKYFGTRLIRIIRGVNAKIESESMTGLLPRPLVSHRFKWLSQDLCSLSALLVFFGNYRYYSLFPERGNSFHSLNVFNKVRINQPLGLKPFF